MKATKLESERLILVPLSLNHLSTEYVDWMNDVEVIKHLESGGNYTFEMLSDFLKEQEEKNILFWAIHIKKTNKHIGVLYSSTAHTKPIIDGYLTELEDIFATIKKCENKELDIDNLLDGPVCRGGFKRLN